MVQETPSTLPTILAGPMVRHSSKETLTFWLVTSCPCEFSLRVFDQQKQYFNEVLCAQQVAQVQVGAKAFITLLNIDGSFPDESRLHYDIGINSGKDNFGSVSTLIPDLLYPDEQYPSFLIPGKLDSVLHGSCRKPHFDSEDGLLRVDAEIASSFSEQGCKPDLLIMSGDQVYADDVSGPTLFAIHQVIDKLGLFHEPLKGATVSDSKELMSHPYSFYRRPELLPDDKSVETFYNKFFKAKRKPVFTSVNANNHLISFSEVMAMYLLVWSPTLWAYVDLNEAPIEKEFSDLYKKEQQIIERFVGGLPKVRRALAHIPVYMIFDDHDITDDWNLTRGWEEAAYGNPFGKRIIGNALIAYWLCQGWGNGMNKFVSLQNDLNQYFDGDGLHQQDELIDRLLDWDQWHYHLDTVPKVVVLDTRTQRWRSESSLSKPSGLMDWEALCELQQELIGHPSVIMVSAAPVFGVKLIETIQRIFTFFGRALVVDAENWMAHKGTASVILNIFRHHKTPPNFMILSGDVHYSFVYDVTLRFRRNSPRILQFTSSGIKNQFPDTLLRWFDKLNRILYAKKSPLNWFTQRRYMRVATRRPEGQKFRTLLNQSGIGLLEIDEDFNKVKASSLAASGATVAFRKSSKEEDD